MRRPLAQAAKRESAPFGGGDTGGVGATEYVRP